MANGKRPKKKGGLKKFIGIILILLVIGGGYMGWIKYNAYKKHMVEQKAREESELQKRLADEARKKELERLKKEMEALIARMREALKRKDYKLVRELADSARKIALANGFSTAEIDAILKQMELEIALARLIRLEKKNDDIYSYSYVRGELRNIPRFPEIARRWDRLWMGTFRNEYLVLLEMADTTSRKTLNAESPEINYSLSKQYLRRADFIRKTYNVFGDLPREKQIADCQNDGFFSNIGRSTHPVNLYR